MKQIQNKLEKVRQKLSILNDKLIESGRGFEKCQDTMKKTDSLSVAYTALILKEQDLRQQLEMGKPTNWIKRY